MSARGCIGRRPANLGDGRVDVRPSRRVRAETCVLAPVSTTGGGMNWAPKVVLCGLEVRPTVTTCAPYLPGHGTPVAMAVEYRPIDHALETATKSTFSRFTWTLNYLFLRPQCSTRTTIRVANKASIVSYVSRRTPHVPPFLTRDRYSSRTSDRRPSTPRLWVVE